MQSAIPRTIISLRAKWRRKSAFLCTCTENVPGIQSHDTSHPGLPGKCSLADFHLMYKTWMPTKHPRSNQNETFDSHTSIGAWCMSEWKCSLWVCLGILSWPQCKARSHRRAKRHHWQRIRVPEGLCGLQSASLRKVCCFNTNGHQQSLEYTNLALG